MTPDKRTLMALLGSTLLLAACDLSFLDEEAKIEAKREAEGRAIGSACRHGGRALEGCYERNPRMSKAAILTGWREMDSYMRENNIQVVSPAMPEPGKEGDNAEEHPKSAATDEAPKAAEAAPEEKPKAAAAPPGKKAAEAPAAKKAAEIPMTLRPGSAAPVRVRL